MNLFNFKMIAALTGTLLMIVALMMGVSMIWSFYYGENWEPLALSAGVTFVSGVVLRALNRNNKNRDVRKRDGFLIVTISWVAMALFGSLPYLISGYIPGFTNALFETMSGFTTTGATILTDIEALPHDLLFWRSTTQWIGGMGIIVLAVAILPFLGIGGMELFMAEAPGIATDKLTPRISGTAKRLWLIYVGLTFLETIVLKIVGMNWFDAINHAFTTMATGGFSTKNASIAFYSPTIQWVIIVFMILAGINFTLHYHLIKGRLKNVLGNEELKWFLGLIFGISILVAGLIMSADLGGETMEESFRIALFQVSSILTSTGYATFDYTLWGNGIVFLFFLMLFSGAMAGSTSGGIKLIRHIVLAKHALVQIKRQLHPSAILPIRINGRAMPPETASQVVSFILIYLLFFVSGSIGLTFSKMDMASAMSAAATCMGNIGPGIGTVGPVENFAHIPDAGKWILSFLMLLGRLELFTVLVLFMPHFWSNR